MAIQLEIEKLEAKNTLLQYHKTRFDSKLFFFLKVPLLMLTNQNKAFFIVLTYQNKVLCIKIMRSSESVLRTVAVGNKYNRVKGHG